MRPWVLLLALSACGTDTTSERRVPGPAGQDGESCTTEQFEDHVTISCPDGSTSTISNGKDGVDGTNGSDGKDGINGTNGKDGDDYEAPETLEGYWTLPNGGYLELIENADKRIIVYGTQRMYTVNHDGGLALHPNISGGPHLVKNGVITGEYTTNYSSSTHDVERDGTTSNITGSRKTVYRLWREDGKLKIRFRIYSSNGLAIEVDRTITSE